MQTKSASSIQSVQDLSPEVIVKFTSKLSKDGPLHPTHPELGNCWQWTAAKDINGYGRIKIGGRTCPCLLTHRLSWIIHTGTISKDDCVLHSCDNPPCCNPSHLFLGTRDDNNQDKIKKGRARHGHLYGEGNPNSKLTWDMVNSIREHYRKGESQTSIQKMFGLPQWKVSRIVLEKIWKTPASRQYQDLFHPLP